MALNPGTALLNGQYRIVRQLGRGGFGFVYLAHDMLLGEDVAIKELIPALVGDEETLKRFLAEAKATMRLAHEHVVRTHNVFSEGGNYYIVMEYMAGGTLEDRLKEGGPVPVREAVRITAEVCQGLSHAHGRGVVHCDLKPANILFDAPPPGTMARAKVADFGIAHVSEQMLSRSWQTHTGFVAGTLPYMSPEQADGVRDDPRIDVYALGAVLYRMLTGRLYLDFDQRDTPGAQADNVYRIRRQPPQPPSIHNPSVPRWLDATVLKALAKQPGERFPGTAELASALSRRIEPAARSTHRGPGPAAPSVPRRGAAPSRTHRTAATSSGPPSTGIRPAPTGRGMTVGPRTATGRRSPLPAWFWPLVGGVAALLVLLAVIAALMIGGGDGAQGSLPPPGSSTAATIIAGDGSPQPTRTRPPQATELLPAATNTPWPTETATEEPLGTEPPLATQPLPTSTAAAPAPTRTSPPAAAPPAMGKIAFTLGSDIYVMDEDGGDVQRLTETPAEEWHPAWSPDGARLIFQCMAKDLGSQVCAVNADGSGYTRISTWSFSEAGAQRPVWSPDGRRIAVSREPPSGGQAFLWVMAADGSDGLKIVEGRDPHWSPDGSQIAFIRHDGTGMQIWTTTPDGATVQRLTEGSQGHMYPTWSPDGRQIAFELDNSQVAVMNADGGPARVVADLRSWNLSWSPDGSRLVIAPSSGGIWVVNVEDGSKTQIHGEGTQPAWQPLPSLARTLPEPTPKPAQAALRIAFFSDRYGGRGEIHLMDADGGGQTRLTEQLRVPPILPDQPPGVNSFGWSASANLFMYSSGYGAQLYTVSAAGRRQTLLVTPAGFAAVSPDGQQIAYEDVSLVPAGIALMGIDGSGQAPFAADANIRFGHPTWSADGQRVAFSCGADLCVQDLGGGVRSTLIKGGLVPNLYACAWSPVSRYLACNTLEQTSRLYLVDLETNQATKIVDDAWSPAWSPDGSRIAFDRSDYQVWTVSRDGGDLKQLTSEGRNCCPVWVAGP